MYQYILMHVPATDYLYWLCMSQKGSQFLLIERIVLLMWVAGSHKLLVVSRDEVEAFCDQFKAKGKTMVFAFDTREIPHCCT